MKSIYKIREAGREYCQTEGSQHYKSSNVIEPMDLIIAKGLAEDFCLANIIKYASRFKKTQNLEDLRKISDYSHILCGYKLTTIDKELISFESVQKVARRHYSSEAYRMYTKSCMDSLDG